MYYYPRVLSNYMHTEPEREYAHQNELSVKTLTRPLKSVSQIVMRVAVMVFACPLPATAIAATERQITLLSYSAGNRRA